MDFLKEWLLNRFSERTTWDGVIIVLLSLGIILFKDLIALIAWGTLIYGVWTIIRSEIKKRSSENDNST